MLTIGRTDLAQLPSRFHGRVERAAELVSQSGSVRAALVLDRRSFVVGEKVIVKAVVCNQTDAPLHCVAVLEQVIAFYTCLCFHVQLLCSRPTASV